MSTHVLPNLNFKYWLSICLYFTFIACSDNAKQNKIITDYELITIYFKEQQKFQVSDSIKTLFVLTDYGCMPCNKNFAEVMVKNLNNPSVLFLILAAGSNIDASEFMKSKNKIFFDLPENVKHHLFENSKVFFFKKNEIDTTIIINAQQIENQIDEINKRLSHL